MKCFAISREKRKRKKEKKKEIYVYDFLPAPKLFSLGKELSDLENARTSKLDQVPETKMAGSVR